jgi:hypothetical protein
LKILYAWEWGTASGHLRRFVPLASRLKDAGHEVTIVAKELHKLPSLFLFGSYPWVQSPDSGRARDPITSPRTFAEVAHNLGLDAKDRIAAVFGAWHEILRQHRPDLVICDFGVAASWVAAAMGIQTVRIGTGYSCPPTNAESIEFLPGPTSTSSMAEMVLAQVAIAMQFLGLKHQPLWNEVLLPPERTLLASVPMLDPYHQNRLSDEYSGTWDHDGQLAPPWRGQGKYRALAYLKPFSSLPQLLAALHTLGVETVLYGDGIPDDLIRPVRNPQLIISEVPLSLSHLSQACDFVLCNGNHGTTAKSLAQGIPVYAIPLFLEQRVTAERVKSEGWGVFADPRLPHEYVGKATEITSSSIRGSVSHYPSQVAIYFSRGLEHAWQKLQAFL